MMCSSQKPKLLSNKSESTSTSDVHDIYLHPPKPQKQFLISPPASPPVGWEPVDEAQPVINPELLAALASLTPGQAHELHPQSESQPGIIVHICEEKEGEDSDNAWKPKIKIQKTAKPGTVQSEPNSSESGDNLFVGDNTSKSKHQNQNN